MRPLKAPVSTPAAPAAIGPYSQGITWGDLLFVSGQIPLDPKTGELVGQGDIRAQTLQVMSNLEGILAAANGTMADLLRTTIYLVDLEDFSLVNTLYAQRTEGAPPPARSTIQVAGLPKGALIEIDAIAAIAG